MVNKLLLILFLSLLALSCGSKVTKDSQRMESPKDCETLYVVLPANFIIDVAAGAEVVLNPSAQKFMLFCSPQTARTAVQQEVEAGRFASADDWRIYKLGGGFLEIAGIDADSHYYLTTPAKVEDWVQ